MKEEWKMYHGYRVSNTGRCQWNDNGVWREKKSRIKKGQEVFQLKENGRKQRKVAKTTLLYELFGIERPTRILPEEEAMKHITDKHGDKFTPIGEYTEANKPMLFRCNVCGCEFEDTPQHVAIYDEPCEQCRSNKVEENRRKRKELIKKEREAKRDRLLSPDCKDYEVYIYVFDDGCAYVGLSYNGKRRGYQHKCDQRSQVYKHSKKTGLPIPQREVVETDLNAKEATRLEDEWKRKLGEKYTILNVGPTGEGIGSLGGVWKPHTLEEAREIARHCSTRREIKNTCSWAYDLLKRHGELPPKCKSHGGLLQRFQRRMRAELTITWE